MESVFRVQILNGTDCVPLYANANEKGMNPFVFPCPSYGWIEQTGSFNLSTATSLGEGKFWIQSNSILFKNWPRVTSCLWQGWGGINIYLHTYIYIKECRKVLGPIKNWKNVDFHLITFAKNVQLDWILWKTFKFPRTGTFPLGWTKNFLTFPQYPRKIYHYYHHQVVLTVWILFSLSLSLTHTHTHTPFIMLGPLPGIQCLHIANVWSFGWSTNAGVSMCRSPEENVPYEFILTSAAASSISCSFLDNLWNGW